MMMLRETHEDEGWCADARCFRCWLIISSIIKLIQKHIIIKEGFHSLRRIQILARVNHLESPPSYAYATPVVCVALR